MTKEEKERIQFMKCGEYFHNVEKCPNPGRMCFTTDVVMRVKPVLQKEG